MHQPLLGALIPLIICLFIYVRRHQRLGIVGLLIMPTAMLTGAIWAIIPDLPRLIGWSSLYHQLAQARWTNIFFAHYTIDQIETTTLDTWTPLINTLFAIIVLIPMLIAWRELHTREHLTDHHKPKTKNQEPRTR